MRGIFTLFSKTHSLKTGIIIIAVFSIISKFLGLLRYALIAGSFGTGPVADSYIAAFRIPDFIYNTVVFGALSVAFIPVFLDLYEKGKRREGEPQDFSVEPTEEGLASVNVDFQSQLAALFTTPLKILKDPVKEIGRSIKRSSARSVKSSRQAPELHFELTNALLTILSITVFVIGALGWIIAPAIVPRLVPGFDPERIELTISMTRVMLLSPLIFCVSNIIGSVLQAFRRFTFFALAPVFYNLGIIFGILGLYPMLGPIGLAWGVVFGAFLHLLIQLPPFLKLGFRFRFTFGSPGAGVRRVLRAMVPRTIALSAQQANQLVNTFLASALPAGSVVVFYNAYDLETLPVSFIAVSLAVASFPILGGFFAQGKNEDFRRVFLKSLDYLLRIMIPLTVFLILLRAQAVRLTLGYGLYNWHDTVRTLEIFAILAASLAPQSVIPLISRAFYAREKTAIPVAASVVAIASNIALAFFLTPIFGLNGLAYAFTISAYLHSAILFFELEREIGRVFHGRNFWLPLARFGLSTVLASAALYTCLHLIAGAIGTDRVWSLAVQTIASFTIGIGSYILLLWIFGDEPVSAFVKKRLRLRL